MVDFQPIDSKRDRKVPLRIDWTEGNAAGPVVLFSQGLGGSGEGNPDLGTHWASKGLAAGQKVAAIENRQV